MYSMQADVTANFTLFGRIDNFYINALFLLQESEKKKSLQQWVDYLEKKYENS